jgi:hypothetical protein
MLGFFSFKYLAVPQMVPPVPTFNVVVVIIPARILLDEPSNRNDVEVNIPPTTTLPVVTNPINVEVPFT